MDYQEQDNRICLFYVVDRVSDIIKDSKTHKEMIKKLTEFQSECTYNLGVNAIHNHYTERE
tara:strand:- start:383 stop:565 length:183 start_codon:yes stop_codon:yes gene_type:complete